MSGLMDIYKNNVSNTDSSLIQCASENVESIEKFSDVNSFSANDIYRKFGAKNFSVDNKFKFDTDPNSSYDTEHQFNDTNNTPPTLEQVIQENVSRSTAKLLTQNSLKHLNKGLMITPGGDVSHQFSVATPKYKSHNNTALCKDDGDPGLDLNFDENYDYLDEFRVDSNPSSIRLNKVTYEMYKLFRNIRAFEKKSHSIDDFDFDSNIEEDNQREVSVIKELNMSDGRKMSIVSSSFTDRPNVENMFESHLRPEGLQSLSTAYPEEGSSLRSNTLNRFEKSSLNSANLTINDEKLRVIYHNNYGENENNDDQNYPLFTGKSEFPDVNNLNLPRFTTSNSEYKDLEQEEPLDYGSNNNSDKHKGSFSMLGFGCFNSENNKRADVPREDNRQSLNLSYETKVYVPLDRWHLMPKKRAVIVGCNYLQNPDAELRGCCNDAFVFAQLLVRRFNFDPKNIILLLDTRPSPTYTRNLSHLNDKSDNSNLGPDFTHIKNTFDERKTYPSKKTSMFGRHLVERDLKHLTLNDTLCLDSAVLPAPPEMHPTRSNVFRSLKWLNFSCAPNDFAVFYFSGHSVQVDDLSGYEGDGFDEAIVPSDFQNNGLVTCNDLKCIFQSLGSTCRLNVFFDSSNLQTVVGPSSRSGPVKGSMMKGFWPFSEPTGKLNSFECSDSVFKHPNMMNQMTKVKYLPTIQVESLSSLSDVQLSLDSTHGMVNYLVMSSSNLKTVSIECLFKPLNLECLYSNVVCNSQTDVGDEVVVHGAFTYALMLTLLFDKSNRKAGLGVEEVVDGVNNKLSQLKKLRLPKLNQECEALFYHSSKLPKNTLLFPPYSNLRPNKTVANSLYGFMLPEDGWMFMVKHGRQRAKEQHEKFERMKTDLITLANLNNKHFKMNSTRNNLYVNQSNQNTQGLNNTPSQANFNPKTPNGAVTGRSMTNNVSARVFARNQAVSVRVSARSKTATLNMGSDAASGNFNNYVNQNNKLTQAVPSHNWYGGCVVSGPYNPNSFPNYFNQPTYSKYDSSQYQQHNDDAVYNKLGSLQFFEPITAAMLNQLPTSNSFNVL